MRTVPDALRPCLAGPATTLARCWRLTRRDGAVFAFTDHDEPLQVVGTLFAAATGLDMGEGETAIGLSAGTQEVEGAFATGAIREDDVVSGLFDDARVETFLADWERPDAAMRLDVHEIGEVKWSGDRFTAELRGVEAALDRLRGRVYQRRCSAVLGDGRCGVDLGASGLSAEGLAAAQGAGSVLVHGLGAFERALYVHGRMVLPDRTGAPAREIAGLADGAEDDETRVALLQPFSTPVEAGERVRLTAGCDRTFATCRSRFRNELNFRGFPHLPGLDTALQVGKEDGLHDGSPVIP